VSILQQETRRAVIECGVQPGINIAVARAALGRREHRLVARVARIRGAIEVRHVARLACRGEAQIISDGCIGVALLAFHHRMRAQQREAVEVLLNRLSLDLPAENRVALGAIGAKLPAVNVGVATGAVLANVGEHWLGVASRAGNFFVHAAQRVSRAVVIKFGDGANGSPTCIGVAIFASNVQRTMRTSFRLLLCGRNSDTPHHQNKECHQLANLKCPINDCPRTI